MKTQSAFFHNGDLLYPLIDVYTGSLWSRRLEMHTDAKRSCEKVSHFDSASYLADALVLAWVRDVEEGTEKWKKRKM